MTEIINNIYDLQCASKEVWKAMGDTFTMFSFLGAMAAGVCYALCYADKIAAFGSWLITRITNF